MFGIGVNMMELEVDINITSLYKVNETFFRGIVVGTFVANISTNYLCRNPTLAKCGGEAQHLEKSEDLKSSGTLEGSELDRKVQNTLH
jgi:hypothetical protein